MTKNKTREQELGDLKFVYEKIWIEKGREMMVPF